MVHIRKKNCDRSCLSFLLSLISFIPSRKYLTEYIIQLNWSGIGVVPCHLESSNGTKEGKTCTVSFYLLCFRLQAYKMYTSGVQTGTSAPPEKHHRPKRPLSVSPGKHQESLQNLPGGSCIKWNQVLGADSKAVQCDLCGAWIHSKCEGVSNEIYSMIK